jgi:hypothetical protein
MMSLTFLNHYAPVWLLVALVVIIYAGLKAMKVIPNEWATVLTSVVLSFMLVSSDSIVNYMIKVIPALTLILAISFFAVIMLAFVAKDIEMFKKPLAIIGFALGLFVILSTVFGSFPVANHMLPNTSNSGLDSGMIQLKDYIYSTNFKEGLIFVGSLFLVCFFIIKKK